MSFTKMNDVSRASAHHMKGVTLIELLVVIAILGIIAAFAYPQYQNYLMKSRRTDARSMLTQIASKEEQYFADNKTYTNDLQNLGYAVAANLTTQNGFYTVTAQTVDSNGNPDPYSYKLTATTAGIQVNDACTTLTLDNTGTKGFTPPAATDCW